MPVIFEEAIVPEHRLENVNINEKESDDGTTFEVVAAQIHFNPDGSIPLGTFATKDEAKAFLKKLSDQMVADQEIKTIDMR